MDPHLLLWLGLATVFLGGIGQALKTDRFDLVLAFFGAPPLPKIWVPRVTVFIGILAAVVTGYTSGSSLEQSITQALAVGLGSIFAIAAHELAGRNNDGQSASTSKPAPRDVDGPGPSGTAVVSALCAALAIGAATQGCALFAPGSKFPSDAEKAAACVVADVESGQTNVAQILLDCRGSETALVLDVVGTLLASPQFVMEHPEQHPPLKASYAILRGTR